MIVIMTPFFDRQRAVSLTRHLVDKVGDYKDCRRKRELFEQRGCERIKVSGTIIESEHYRIRRHGSTFPLGVQKRLQGDNIIMFVEKFKLALKVSYVHGQIPRIAADFVVASGYAVITKNNDLVPVKPRKKFCESQEISYPVKRFRQNHPSAPQIVRLQKRCSRNSFVRIYTIYGRGFKLTPY